MMDSKANRRSWTFGDTRFADRDLTMGPGTLLSERDISEEGLERERPKLREMISQRRSF